MDNVAVLLLHGLLVLSHNILDNTFVDVFEMNLVLFVDGQLYDL